MLVEENLKEVSIDGAKLSYYQFGKGIPIVFLHGITTYSFMWRNIAPKFSDHYTVYVIDLLGCGNSDQNTNLDFSIKNQAHIIKLFIESIIKEPVHLVAHDIGGGIAQIVSVTTDKLLSLTLINSIGYDYWPVQPITSLRTPIIRQIAMSALDFGMLKLIVKRGMYYKEKITSEMLDYFLSSFNSTKKRKAFLHLTHSLDNHHLVEIAEDLKHIKIPALIIRGEADLFLSSEICESLHRDIKQSKYIRIEKGGHFIQEDDPEKLTDLIVSFLKDINAE